MATGASMGNFSMAGLDERTAVRNGRPPPVVAGGPPDRPDAGLSALIAALVRRMAGKGRSLAQIALTLCLAADAVLAAVVHLGLSRPSDRPVRVYRSPRYWSAAQVQRLVWLWCHSMQSPAEIGEELDRKRNSVTAKARSLGLYCRDRAQLQALAAKERPASGDLAGWVYFSPGRPTTTPPEFAPPASSDRRDDSAPTLAEPEPSSDANGTPAQDAGETCDSCGAEHGHHAASTDEPRQVDAAPAPAGLSPQPGADRRDDSAPTLAEPEPSSDANGTPAQDAADSFNPGDEHGQLSEGAAESRQVDAAPTPAVAAVESALPVLIIEITDPELMALIDPLRARMAAQTAAREAREARQARRGFRPKATGEGCRQRHTWGAGPAANPWHRLLAYCWDRGMVAQNIAEFINTTLGTTLGTFAISSRMTDIGLISRGGIRLYYGVDPQLSPHSGHLAAHDLVEWVCQELHFIFYRRRTDRGVIYCPRVRRPMESANSRPRSQPRRNESVMAQRRRFLPAAA